MSNIQISNLNPAGSDLFAGTESFLTELQDTDTTQIVGGGKQPPAPAPAPAGGFGVFYASNGGGGTKGAGTNLFYAPGGGYPGGGFGVFYASGGGGKKSKAGSNTIFYAPGSSYYPRY